MSWSISDDKLTSICRKVAIGNIYGYTLLSLGTQTITKQCIVDMLTSITHPTTITLKSLQLIIVEAFTIVE
jgi:hypothetical protein